MLRGSSRLLSLLLPFALLACEDSPSVTGPDEPGNQGGFGTGRGFTLLLTDAPGDFLAAVVTIEDIRLQGSGQAISLLDEPFTGDLLELRNEVATLVQEKELPAGGYSQLRAIISGGYIEVETETGSRIYASSPDYEGLPADADVYGTLHMPSMGQSGLKINLPGGQVVIGEGETIVMLDFDVEESFGHEAGKSGKWVMHPMIKASNVTIGGYALARLQLGQGVVLPELAGQLLTLAGFKARLAPAAGGDTIDLALTDADADGIFEALFKGLKPGDYTLTFVGPAGLLVGFSPTLPVTLTVGPNQTATQLVTLTSAAQPGTVTATLKLGTGITLPTVGGSAVTLGQFKARLTPTGGTAREVTFTDANTDGTFEASFADLTPGAYSLTLLAPAGMTATYGTVTLPVAITLASGITETREFVISAAAATP